MLILSFAFVIILTVDPVSLVQFATEIVKLMFFGAKAYQVIKQIRESSKLNKQ
jgi:hypothetical protein